MIWFGTILPTIEKTIFPRNPDEKKKILGTNQNWFITNAAEKLEIILKQYM